MINGKKTWQSLLAFQVSMSSYMVVTPLNKDTHFNHHCQMKGCVFETENENS
jgi:hypothetical protein